MAKTIKFNLILDGNPVRNLDGLRENFSIEDMLGYYDKGLLERWLKVRGFETELEAVKNIDKEESIKNKIKELVKIFNVETDDDVIDKGLEIVEYSKMFRELNAIYAKQAYDKKMIIEDYHKGYDLLINHIIENKENMAILKADTRIMEEEYAELFKLDNVNLYNRLFKEAPKVIFAFLMRDTFRKCWLVDENSSVIKSITSNLLEIDFAKEVLADDLRIVSRDTDGVFDEIVSSEKKVMLITIGANAFARGAGNFGEKLSREDINGKLPILDGLLYNCTNAYRELLYVEV